MLASVGALAGQGLAIAPHAVFIDHRQRSGALTLYNPGHDPVEVDISIFYGYTTYDSTGNFTLKTIEQPDSSQPSAAGWIQAFPKRLIVGPQERQTVRLLASPPPGLRDGEYWARIAFTVKAGQIPVTGVQDTARIKVGLELQVRTIIGIMYRKGAVTTGVTVDGLRAMVVGDSIVVRAHLARQGNATYLGTARGVLAAPNGREVATFKGQLGVYFDATPRWAAAIPTPLAPGKYRLRLELTSEREDLEDLPNAVLKAAPVRDSLEVVIP
jgi:P pilus assembly chaperone PapD